VENGRGGLPSHAHTQSATTHARPATSPHRNRRPKFTARQYAALIELAPDAAVVTDGAGRILLVNRQAEVLFGYERDDLLGRPVETIIPERFHAAHHQHRAAYVAAPHVRPLDGGLHVFGRRRDGTECSVEVSLSPFQGEDGKLLITACIRDVSDTQRVQAANSELRLMQTLTDTALAHLDVDDLLPELLDRVREVLAVDHAVILLIDDDARTLRVRAGRRPNDAQGPYLALQMGQGVAGRVAATREPLIVPNLRAFPVVSASVLEHQRSAMGVPLELRGRLLGVLAVSTTEPREFVEQDVSLLQRVAERVAVALERTQLYQAEHRARQEAQAALAQSQANETRLRQLQAITASFAQSQTREEVRHVILEELVGALGARAVGLRLVTETELVLEDYASGAGGPLRTDTLRRASAVSLGAEHPAAEAARTGEPVFIHDAEENIRRHPSLANAIREAGPEAVAHLPLLRGDEVFGVLSLHFDEQRSWDAAERTFAVALAGRAAIAYARARLFEAERAARREAEAALARAQASEDRFQRLVDSDIIGIVVGDGESVVDANDAFLQILGYSREDLRAGRLTRQTLSDSQDMRAAGERAVEMALATGTVQPFEREYLRKDGTRVPALVGTALLQREPPLFVSFVVDLTERKRLEREREEARASELVAREVAQHLDQFFAMASHDIRSPLTALIGNVQLAQSRAQRLMGELQERDEQITDATISLNKALGRAEDSLRSVMRLVTLGPRPHRHTDAHPGPLRPRGAGAQTGCGTARRRARTPHRSGAARRAGHRHG
jgi:PAS domain S-box-containing protein